MVGRRISSKFFIAIIITMIVFLLPSAYSCLARYNLSTSVSPVDGGSITPNSGTYEKGNVARLTANPTSGYRFDYWGGDVTGSSSSIDVTMDADKTAIAFFKAQHKLNTSISPGDAGTITPANGTYDEGTKVALVAVPESGYRFDRWSGDVTGSSELIEVTVDAGKTITANFKVQHTLSISVSPTGGGTVTPNGDAYDEGTKVTLSAVPNSGYRFDHWSGDATGSSSPIDVTMNAGKTVTANFKAQYTLSISVSPTGGGIVRPTGGTYDEGTKVTLAAAPASGYRFDRWSGDVTSSSKSTEITMDARKAITANFKAQYTLSISTSPTGSGTVTPTGGTYDDGDTVSLTATPTEGYVFDHWGGSLSGNDNTISITINSAKDITAYFKFAEVQVELIEGKNQGLLDVSAYGTDSLDEITLHVTSKSGKPLRVTITAGTIFEPGQSSVQSMLVTVGRKILLDPFESISLEIDAACGNMERSQPGEDDSLTLKSITSRQDLSLLLSLPDFASEPFRVQQFAIWTITDNPTRNGYTHLTSGLFDYWGSGPSDEEIQEIKVLFQEAGISLNKYQALR
jgi:major membrane immunogen (membrane-anchored lipoprotein)